MAITRLGGATAITGTIPQGNIANASLGAVTALPGAIATGKILQIVSARPTTVRSIFRGSSGYDHLRRAGHSRRPKPCDPRSDTSDCR